MRISVFTRILASLLVAALLAGVAALADPAVADAANRQRVDFTVRETLPLDDPGYMLASDIPGCASALVHTMNPTATNVGPFSIFTGSKLVDCGDGNTFSFAYWAWTRECRRTDRGGWFITGGTGTFAGVTGFGRLVGTFFNDDGSPATFCDNDGIDDRWRGVIRFP